MATVSIRYIVDDVDAAIAFYRDNLGFTEVMHAAPAFAMLSLGDLRLAVSATVTRLRGNGVRFRNDIVTGVGGKQILAEDPSGNPVELFEPTTPEARLHQQS
jgi:catechol 2,3-dioxygenase-like lactoylglutathione lyase family enzyme